MTGCLAATAILLGMFVLRGQYWRKKSGKAAMIGRIGTATTALDPAGMVYIFGEYWQATTTGESVEAGSNVMVDAIQGLRILVHPVAIGEPPDPRAVGDRRTVIPVR
jgi:membrane-bound ClpP family serine protease